MSDTDADAGDDATAGDAGFDKEAEREKLREKFARDEQKRQSTRRMSELLLKGATMTNKHCDACGDPVFRQNGQEFCATCQAEGREGGAQAQADGQVQPPEQQADEATGQGEGSDDTTSGEPASVESTADDVALDAQPGDDPAGRDVGDTVPAQRHTPGGPRAPPSQAGSAGGNQSDRRPTDGRSAQPNPTPSTDQAGDIGEAREALVAALTRHASAGADQDDPRAARDHLAAAREAAEALSALRR